MASFVTKIIFGFVGATRFWRGKDGNIGPIMALMLVPIVAALGMATEGSGWYLRQNSMQNAADAAAIAAAINVTQSQVTTVSNDCSNAGDPCHEARAVARNYGHPDDGTGNVVVPTANFACPSPLTGSTCYQVTITEKVPVYLLQIVGFRGDTTIGSTPAQTIRAVAVASTGATSGTSSCLIGLKGPGGGDALDIANGTFVGGGCGIYSNGTASIKSSSSTPTVYSVGTCSCDKYTKVSTPAPDPYVGVSTTPPAGTPSPSVPTGTTPFQPGIYTISSQLGNISLSPGVYYFQHGLNSSGTISGTDVTIIVTGGDANLSGSTYNITARSTGPTAGVAIMTSGGDINIKNNIALNVTGAVYARTGEINVGNNTISTNSTCMQIVGQQIVLKNNGFINLDASNCAGTGVAVGGGNARYAKLVQ